MKGYYSSIKTVKSKMSHYGDWANQNEEVACNQTKKIKS